MRRLILILPILLAACSSPTQDSRYYTLSPSPAAAPVAGAGWSLGTVDIPALIDRPQIVLTTGANGVELLEYDRWAEPMQSMVPRVLGQDLTARLGVPAAARQGRITVTIDAFDSDASGQVRLSAVWSIESAGVTVSHLFHETATAGSGGTGSVVAAMSGLLGRLSDTIAATLAAPAVKAT